MLPASGIMVFDTENRPETRNTYQILPRNDPDRIHVSFDDHRLLADAGLILPVPLAHHLGLDELVDRHVDLGDAPGRANAGDKMLTLVASALTRCVLAAPNGYWAVWSRPRPRWEPSRAASGGATRGSWTG